MNGSYDIAIVGGGVAGTLLAVQLAMQAPKPLHIALYDTAGAFARGVAYRTLDPTHLLNVRADRIGAFHEQPEGFYSWLLAHANEWREAHPMLAELEATPESFLPRMLYGDYIADLMAEAERNHPQVTIGKEAKEVTDVSFAENAVTLALADGSQHTSQRLVLAIGNLPIPRPGNEDALLRSGHYAGPIWEAPEGSILTRTTFTVKDSPVLIIGTGLTMIDALLSLRRKGYAGKVIAASGNTLLPQPHFSDTPPYPRFLLPSSAPRTAFGLVRAVRKEAVRAKQEGKDWRGVIDSLRTDTPLLWAGLPERERRKLRRILPFWNTHRHRMPPQSAAMLEREIGQGKFEIIKGRILHIEPVQNGLNLQVAGRKEPVLAAHVLNCSGPESAVVRSQNPLLRALLEKGAIRPGPLDIGIAADDGYHARGNAAQRLFVIGPQLAGERFETIAIPELRQQAEALARSLLALP